MIIRMDNYKLKIYRFNKTEFKKNYYSLLRTILLFAFVFAALYIGYIYFFLPDALQIHEANRPFWFQAWTYLLIWFEIGLAGGGMYFYLVNRKLLKRSYIIISDKEMIYFKVKTIVPKWQMRLMWSSLEKEFFTKKEYLHYEKIYLGSNVQIRKNKIHTLIITGVLPYEESIEMNLDLSDPVIVKKGDKRKHKCRIPAAFDQMDEIEKAVLNFPQK